MLSIIPTITGQAQPSAVGAHAPLNLKEVKEGADEITGTTKQADTLAKNANDPYANVGRNDECPCGAVNPATGKVYKYKQCGLINAPHHKK